MGPDDLSLPSSASHSQSSAESAKGENLGSAGLPQVALGDVVVIGDLHAHGATLHAASLPFSIGEPVQGVLGAGIYPG